MVVEIHLTDRYFDDYQAEMQRLEKQQSEMRHALDQAKLDQYNSTKSPYDLSGWEGISNCNAEFAPEKGDTWLEYYQASKTYAKINAKNNIKTHINGKNGHWHTHETANCFMCEDSNLISILVRVIGFMANKYPASKF